MPNAAPRFLLNHPWITLIAEFAMLAGLAWKGKEQAPRTWLEDGRDANGRAYALGQQDLVVLRAEGTHHQAKDVQQAAGEEQLSRAVFVIYDAHGRALCCVSCFAALRVEKGATACSYHGAHEEYLQRGNPCNGAGRVRRQQRVLVVFLEGTNTYFELKSLHDDESQRSPTYCLSSQNCRMRHTTLPERPTRR
jgi:hypothetical protein